jgi:hypothetical protein
MNTHQKHSSSQLPVGLPGLNAPLPACLASSTFPTHMLFCIVLPCFPTHTPDLPETSPPNPHLIRKRGCMLTYYF